MHNLDTLAQHHLMLAQQDEHGRSTDFFLHDGPLRQSVIALTEGSVLGEHDTPPAASLQLLRGLIVLTNGETNWELGENQLMRIPHVRHSVQALSDSVMLLTAVTSISA